MNLSIDDKIFEVERLLEEFRWARGAPATAEHKTWLVLRALASELRGRKAEAPSQAETQLERRRLAVIASKTRLGYANGPLVGLAQELLGRWETVLQGLRLLAEVNRRTAEAEQALAQVSRREQV